MDQKPREYAAGHVRKKYNIAIIDSNIELRRNLSDYLAATEQLECVMAVDSIEKFVKFHRDFLQIDLVLIEDDLPSGSGIDGIPLVRHREPHAEIVVFSAIDQMATILHAFSRGATGYLLKEYTMPELEEKLLYCLEGYGVLLSPGVARKLIGHFHPKQFADRFDNVKISDREGTVIQYLLDGLSYQQIANRLGISLNGVRQHVFKIYRKLNINKRHQLIEMKERGILR